MTAVNANAKQLAAIEAVASKVNATEAELNALAERTTRQAVALCVALWRHACRSRAATPVNVANPMATTDVDDYVLVGDSNTTAAASSAAPAAAAAAAAATRSAQKFAVDTTALRRAAYDLRMGTHWRDEALMQQLFALDNVFGDDQVKAKRKEQVTRIKALIARAERLRVRNRRLDALLKRLPQPPAAGAAAPTEPASPTPSAAGAEKDGEVKYAEPAALAAAAAAATATEAGAADAVPQPMDTDAQPAAAAAAAAAAAPAAAPRAATPPPPAPAAAAAPKSPALKPSALDVKHAPEQAAAIAAAAAAAVAPAAAAAAKAASRPATPEKAKNEKAPSRPASPPKTAPSPAPAAAAAAAAAAEDDAESSGFVIPAKVKAQWPRLRAEFDTRDAGDSIHLSAALPGVLPQDLGVSLSADNTVLTVRGLKRPQPQPQRRRATPFGGWFGSAYDYEEDDAEEEDNSFGWFEEQFSIPARLGVDASKAERVFRGGRLTIVLPRKAAPQPQPQTRPTPRCAPAYAPAYASAQPQYYYRQPQPSPFGGHPFFGGRTGGWF